MTHDSTPTLACARCGASPFMTVEGLCSNCLLRLALATEPEKGGAAADGSVQGGDHEREGGTHEEGRQRKAI